jgi:hypothetical protein
MPFSKAIRTGTHQPGSVNRVPADDSHAVPQNVREGFSQTGSETDLSSSTEFLEHSARRMLNENNQGMSKLFFPTPAFCRGRAGIDREPHTRSWLQIQRNTV